jgi:hypothetical protein
MKNADQLTVKSFTKIQSRCESSIKERHLCTKQRGIFERQNTAAKFVFDIKIAAFLFVSEPFILTSDTPPRFPFK